MKDGTLVERAVRENIDVDVAERLIAMVLDAVVELLEDVADRCPDRDRAQGNIVTPRDKLINNIKKLGKQ